MSLSDILTVAKLVTPIVSALTAAMVIALGLINERRSQKRLKSYVLLYLLSTTVSWIGILFYFYAPIVFVYLNSFFFLSTLAMPLFLYAFIFKITRTRTEEHFGKKHLLIPLVMFLFMLILTVVTPMEDQLRVIQGKGGYDTRSDLFFVVTNGKSSFRLIFSLYYIVLSLYRLPGYRQYILNYSANEDSSYLRWVKTYLVVMLLLIPVPLIWMYLSGQGLMGSPYILFHIFMLIFQFSFMTYHVVNNHFVVSAPENQSDESLVTPLAYENKSNDQPLETTRVESLNKEYFERYMAVQKPYLNPDFKITDLATALSTNRSYVSSFINTEYEMNFSAYINSLRIEEFEYLRICPENEGLTMQELSEKAGFGSYRSYHRCISNRVKKKG
jgi:AraC-like DNA-binding protein